MTGSTAPTMASLLADIKTVATSALGFVGDVTSAIMGDPFLLFTVGFLFLGGVIGILGRLLSRN